MWFLSILLQTPPAAALCVIPVHVRVDTVPDVYLPIFWTSLIRAVGAWDGLDAGIGLELAGSTEQASISGAITVGCVADHPKARDSADNRASQSP